MMISSLTNLVPNDQRTNGLAQLFRHIALAAYLGCPVTGSILISTLALSDVK